MGENIVGRDRRGFAMPGLYLPRQVRREKTPQGLDARLVGGGGDVFRGINAQGTHSSVLKEAQKRAVVGADVDDQGAGFKLEAAEQILGIGLEMADKNRGGAGDINVILEK